MNVTEIITRVQRQFGDEASIQITEADVIRWINDAQRDIALHNQLFQTRATTAVAKGVASYTMPPDILTVHSVRFGGNKLVGLSMQEAESSIPDTSESGTPQKYWIWGGTLTLFPIPDQTDNDDLLIFYTRNPTPIAAVADLLELPEQYHNRIVEYCLQQAYELDENWAAAQAKGQQFAEGVSKLKAEEEWAQRDFYPSITSSPEDYGYGGRY